MSSEIAIKVENLSKCFAIYERPQDRLKQMVLGQLRSLLGKSRKPYFREFWALKDVSFEVKKGETVGIIGRNGSGKSTLLQMICGTLNPTSGSVQTFGRVAALLELGAGFNPEFTGRENVYLNATVLGLTQAEIDERFDQIAEFADIGDFIGQPVKTYSSGMYVRLAFSVAIATQPDILVIDEALAVGDAHFQLKCMAAIKRLQQSGVTILLVTHDVSTIRQFCKNAVWIERGHSMEYGTALDITSNYTQFIFSNQLLSPKFDNTSKSLAFDLQKESFTPAKPLTSIPAYNLDIDSNSAAWQPSMPPLNRWGSHVGIITGCLVRQVGKIGFNQIENFGEIEIIVRFKTLTDIDWNYFSIALAIKNSKGQDLLIFATWESSYQFMPITDFLDQHIIFRFKNNLNSGRYTVTPALENRSLGNLQYYDFYECAQTFEVLHHTPWMGITVVESTISHPKLIARHTATTPTSAKPRTRDIP
jgi:lipopolysaccharide transport system ATP-binding protein